MSTIENVSTIKKKTYVHDTIPANKANKCIDMRIQPEKKKDLANKMKTIVLFELIIRSTQKKITHSLAGF